MKTVFKNLLIITIIVISLCILCGCQNNKNESNSTQLKNTVLNSSKTNTNTNSTNNKNTQVDIKSIDFVTEAEKQMSAPQKGETVAVIHVKNYGNITVKFFQDVAPKAVENFLTHAKNGYYNGVSFHRVINDFMIQGGDPTGTGSGGESIWNKDFEDEFSYSLVPYRGALCMANAGSNTNGSQFFIEQANYSEETGNLLKQYEYPEKLIEAYKKYGGSMHLFLKHTVFGQVVEGMDVVDKIAGTKTDSNDKPVEDVIIESIEVKTL